jgi:hypothetical protein
MTSFGIGRFRNAHESQYGRSGPESTKFSSIFDLGGEQSGYFSVLT